jgi:hypothetical protein
LTIEASDEVEATITSSECASDLAGTEPSGVTMMAVMPTPDPVGLPSSAWTPFQARATLRLDDLHAATGAAGAEEASLWLVVRDTSGNVSAPAYLVMTRPSRSALDRGIRALDDLLDAAATASAGPGASALAECGAELQAALDVLQTDPDGAPGAEAVEDGLGALADISAALSGQDWSAVAAQADQVRRQMLGTWRGYDALLPDAL